jgi:hypothetical protein
MGYSTENATPGKNIKYHTRIDRRRENTTPDCYVEIQCRHGSNYIEISHTKIT